MNAEKLSKIVEEMIPQLALIDKDEETVWGNRIRVDLDGKSFTYLSYNNSGKTPMKNVFSHITEKSHDYVTMKLGSERLEKDYICRDIAIEWISSCTAIDRDKWFSILDYLTDVTQRTYENMSVGYNLIIDSQAVAPADAVSIIQSEEGKILDVLAGSNYSYFLTDTELKVIGYDCISWNEMSSKTSYSSIPNFLQPYTSIVKGNLVGITVTRSGDIIIYKDYGMICSIRKNHWTIYENNCVKNLVRDTMKAGIVGIPYHVCCNMFTMMWDMSYRRHGALVVFVKNDGFSKYITNEDSILDSPTCKGVRKSLKSSVKSIPLGTSSQIKEALVMELSSVDGAIIVNINTGEIKAFGSIIKTAEGVSKVCGARTTAAKSAIRYEGMIPIKVSSDGDITLYVETKYKVSGDPLWVEYSFY